MQVCVNSKEGSKDTVVAHAGSHEPYQFSIVSNFNAGIVVTSVPQSFIVPNNAPLIGRITGGEERSVHINAITGNEQLTPSGEGIVIKQLSGLQQTNKAKTVNVNNSSVYQSAVDEIVSAIKVLPEQPAGQLQADGCSIVQRNVRGSTTVESKKEEIENMGLSNDRTVTNNDASRVLDKYFFLDTEEEVEETIHKHTEETFSHFVVAKKTKAYGSKATVIDTTSKFRIHWQSRDLTSTEECAVQIPFQGVPFIYIGEKAYMCHLGRNKTKSKPVMQADVETDLSQPRRHRSRLTKKQGCPAKIFVKQIAKFPGFKISCNSEYLRTQMSQKLRKAIMDSNGCISYIIQYVGTLPDISEHSNHDIGENTPVKEPIDPLIRDKIVELTWQFGENASPREIKDLLDRYVCEVFKGRDLPSKHRRRFYPSEKDIANYIYKSKLLSKLTYGEREHIHLTMDTLRTEYPDNNFVLEIELDSNYAQTGDFVDGFRVIKDTSISSLTKQKFLFVHQSAYQQRLLKLYGKQVILTEINKRFPNIPFPFYGVFVATNMDYQLIFCFVSQSRTVEYLRQGLGYLLGWNSSWAPKFFIVDFSVDQINVVQELFPSCSVLISDLSREESWKEWLEEPKNCASLQGSKDEVYEKLTAIANSFTEEALNRAAQNLETSQEWRLSESLRDWFTSDWLAEAKRWVAGYRHDEFMTSLYTDGNLTDEVNNLRESHTNHLRNKKMSDFISYLVKVFVPESYQRYVEKNVSDYRMQYFLQNTQNDVPLYLKNKTASVTDYVMQKLREAKAGEYSVNQVQSGIFWVIDKTEPDKTYVVSFGGATSLPSCVCIDWLQYKLPCKHMASVFYECPGWDWDTISNLYTSNPILCVDFSCIDKEHEDNILANWKKEEGIRFCIDRGYMQVSSRKERELANMKNEKGSICSTSENHDDADSGDHSDHHLNSLATDCDKFCQQLSNSIHQVADHAVLQKLKLNLQAVLNDVTLELLKTSEVPTKRVSSSNVDHNPCKKNLKYEKDGSVSTNLQTLTNTSPRSASCVTPKSVEASQLSLPKLSKNEESRTVVPRHTFLHKLDSTGITESSDVWIFDSELDIKLLKVDRQSILAGQTLSLEIIKCVQNILKHQFSDVDGFCEPQKLAQNGTEQFSSKRKVLQLHMLDGDHWSASARTSEGVHIFCCTISSKATVIEQLLRMVPNRSFEDKILFIERVEKEHAVKNCSLYAIAYSVAFLFDIEARHFVFAESEMRSHLAECLEDMCFSMFPVRTIKKSS